MDYPQSTQGLAIKGDAIATAAEPTLPSCVPGRDGPLYPRRGASLAQCPTNLDLSNPAHKMLAFNAMNPADLLIDERQLDDQRRPYIVINARYYLIHPDESVDPETGEVRELARTVLITPEGQSYKTSASHAPAVILRALELYGVDEWAKGIRFRVTERKSRNVNRKSPYHDIRIEG